MRDKENNELKTKKSEIQELEEANKRIKLLEAYLDERDLNLRQSNSLSAKQHKRIAELEAELKTCKKHDVELTTVYMCGRYDGKKLEAQNLEVAQKELLFDVWDLDLLVKRFGISAQHRTEWDKKFQKVVKHFSKTNKNKNKKEQ